MLLKLENENRLYTKKDISPHCKHEEIPWAFLCRENYSVTMQDEEMSNESSADLQFLLESDKEYTELGADEASDSARRPAMNDLRNNGNRDGNITRKEYKCSEGQLETVYDEETGETKVKLFAHEYPIDLKCQLTAEMDFDDEKYGTTAEAVTCNTKEIMSIESRRYDTLSAQRGTWKLCKPDLTNPDSNSSSGTHSSAENKQFSDHDFKRCAKIDSLSDERVQRSRSDLCFDNTACGRSSCSYPTIRNQTLAYSNKNIKTEPYTGDELYSNSNMSASETEWTKFKENQYKGYTTNKRQIDHINSSYEEQWTSANLLPFQNKLIKREIEKQPITSCFATGCSMSAFLSNYYDPTWIPRLTGTVDSAPSENQMFEQLPVSKDHSLHLDEYGQNAQDVAVTQENDTNETTIPSPVYMYYNTHPVADNRNTKHKKKLKRGCRLWEYIRNLLLDPVTNPSLIRWEDRTEGTFKLVQNKKIAYNWGMKKGNTDMSYEKLSRAMRYYYKKKIFQPVLGKRLVYKFGPCATGWKND